VPSVEIISQKPTSGQLHVSLGQNRRSIQCPPSGNFRIARYPAGKSGAEKSQLPQRLKRPHCPTHCTFIVRNAFVLTCRESPRYSLLPPEAIHNKHSDYTALASHSITIFRNRHLRSRVLPSVRRPPAVQGAWAFAQIDCAIFSMSIQRCVQPSCRESPSPCPTIYER
jgi:hypothetical protein